MEKENNFVALSDKEIKKRDVLIGLNFLLLGVSVVGLGYLWNKIKWLRIMTIVYAIFCLIALNTKWSGSNEKNKL